MRISVYDYKDYKRFVMDWIEKTPNGGRGQRRHLAEAIGCQTPFITHVLAGDYQFSAEQAEACSRWMGLDNSEQEYFILLVLRQRAGTKYLENFFSKQIVDRKEKGNQLNKRLEIQETLTLEHQMIYYSSWHYAAIHVSLMVPALQSMSALQKYFQLPLSRIISVLEFLVSIKVIEETKTGYKVVRPVLHLPKDSPLMNLHHTHWRLRGLDHIQSTQGGDNLHYSAIMSLSKEDYDWASEKLSNFLQDIVERVKTSKDEKIAALCFDWFQV